MPLNGLLALNEYLNATEGSAPLAIGKFFPDRVPDLSPIGPFDPATVGEMLLSTAVSPDCSFRLLKQTLDSATETLDIYIYNIDAPHIVALLRAAADRGVRLRVMYDTSDDGAAETQLLCSLLNTNARVAPMARPRSVFTVCHQKFVVVDGKRVLLGSANWAATSYPEVTQANQFKKGNREWVVAVENTKIAAWFATLFQTDWNIPEYDDFAPLEDQGPAMTLPEILVPMATVKVPETIFDITVFPRGVRLMPLISPDNYFNVVHQLLQDASTSIDVQQQSLKAPRLLNGDLDMTKRVNQLLAVLQSKKQAGVRVRVMVSPKFNWLDSLNAARAFDLEENLRAISLDSFTHLHNKGLVIDSSKAVVTSTNWTDNSITRAREAGLLIDDAEVARYYQGVFDLDWKDLSVAPDDLPQHLVAVLQDALLNPGAAAAMRPGEFVT